MSGSSEELCRVKKSDRKSMTAGPKTISGSNSTSNIVYVTEYYVLHPHNADLRHTFVKISSNTSGPEGTIKFCTLKRASVAREYVRWRYEGEGAGGAESDNMKTRGRRGTWRLKKHFLSTVAVWQ